MGFAKPFLLIDDDFKNQRTEWILGYSSLNTSNAMPNKVNKFGLSQAHYLSNDIYTYLTPLNEKKQYSQNNSLLQILWRYANKMDNYIVYALSSFLQIVVLDEHLMRYLISINPPTYQYARYIDWITPYLLNEQTKNMKQNYNKLLQTKKASLISLGLSCMEKIKEQARIWEFEALTARGINPEDFYTAPNNFKKPERTENQIVDEDEEETPVIRTFPEPYIIGGPTKIETVKEEEIDGVILKVQVLTTEVVKSNPNFFKNFSLTHAANQNCIRKADQFSNDLFKIDPASNAGVKIENLDKNNDYNIIDDENQSETSADSKMPQDLYPSYNVEAKEFETVMLFYVKNTNETDYHVSVKVTPGEGNQNMRPPFNEVEDTIPKNRLELWLVCHKVDPATVWGDWTVQWNVHEKPQEQQYYSSYGGNQDYEDVSTGFSYAEFGSQFAAFY